MWPSRVHRFQIIWDLREDPYIYLVLPSPHSFCHKLNEALIFVQLLGQLYSLRPWNWNTNYFKLPSFGPNSAGEEVLCAALFWRSGVLRPPEFVRRMSGGSANTAFKSLKSCKILQGKTFVSGQPRAEPSAEWCFEWFTSCQCKGRQTT